MEPITMAAIGTAILGAYMGNQQQKAQERARRDQALINMYAPLLGQPVQALGMETDHLTPAVVNGVLSGYQMYAKNQTDSKVGKLYEKDSANPLTSAPAEVFIPYAAAPQQSMAQPRYAPVDPNTFFNLYK